MFYLPWPGASLKLYKFAHARIEYGLVSTKTEYLYWSKCRELFANHYHKSKWVDRTGFLLRFPNKHPEKVAARIRLRAVQLQDRMGLKPSQRFSVVDTERDDMVYIEVGKFWRVKHRMAFLTAFVRNAITASNTSLKVLLASGRYFKETQPAVKRLVGGHFVLKTVTLKKFRGWVNEFKKKSAKDVAAMLV